MESSTSTLDVKEDEYKLTIAGISDRNSESHASYSILEQELAEYGVRIERVPTEADTREVYRAVAPDDVRISTINAVVTNSFLVDGQYDQTGVHVNGEAW